MKVETAVTQMRSLLRALTARPGAPSFKRFSEIGAEISAAATEYQNIAAGIEVSTAVLAWAEQHPANEVAEEAEETAETVAA